MGPARRWSKLCQASRACRVHIPCPDATLPPWFLDQAKPARSTHATSPRGSCVPYLMPGCHSHLAGPLFLSLPCLDPSCIFIFLEKDRRHPPCLITSLTPLSPLLHLSLFQGYPVTPLSPGSNKIPPTLAQNCPCSRFLGAGGLCW